MTFKTLTGKRLKFILTIFSFENTLILQEPSLTRIMCGYVGAFSLGWGWKYNIQRTDLTVSFLRSPFWWTIIISY